MGARKSISLALIAPVLFLSTAGGSRESAPAAEHGVVCPSADCRVVSVPAEGPEPLPVVGSPELRRFRLLNGGIAGR